jgi:hypothetical protein
LARLCNQTRRPTFLLSPTSARAEPIIDNQEQLTTETPNATLSAVPEIPTITALTANIAANQPRTMFAAIVDTGANFAVIKEPQYFRGK